MKTGNATLAFEGFSTPTYTQVPDEFFDVIMPSLNEGELKVALYIIRRTFGFKKASDNISLRQMVSGITTKDGRVLDQGTGLKKSAVTRALNSLEDKGIIVSRRNRSDGRGDEPTTYSLHAKELPVSAGRDAPVSAGRDAPVSAGRDTQETVEQETVEQETVTPTPQGDCAILPSEGGEEKQALAETGALLSPPPSSAPPPAPSRADQATAAALLLRDDVEGRLHSKRSEKPSTGGYVNGWEQDPARLKRVQEAIWERWKDLPNKAMRKDLLRIQHKVAIEEASLFQEKTKQYLKSMQDSDKQYYKRLSVWLDEWSTHVPVKYSSNRGPVSLTENLKDIHVQIAKGLVIPQDFSINNSSVRGPVVPVVEPDYPEEDLPF